MLTRKVEISSTLGVVLVVLAVAVITTQLLLVRQNAQLKGQLSAANRRATRTLEATVGLRVPPLRGLDLEGRERVLDYGTDPRRTLLLVFTPTCPWCEKNWPNWRLMIRSYNSQAVRLAVIDLSSTVTPAFLDQRALPHSAVLVQLEPKVRLDYRLTLTPQTILISSDGTVEHVWTGLFSEIQASEVEKALGLRQPLPVKLTRR